MENNEILDQQSCPQSDQPVCCGDALDNPATVVPDAEQVADAEPECEQPCCDEAPCEEQSCEQPCEEQSCEQPAALTLDQIEALIKERTDGLTAMFEEKILRDHRQSEMFDKLYKELETYRKDVYAKMLKPLVTGLVMLLGELERSVERIEQTDNPGERALKMLRDELPEDLLDLLEENGVEPYNTDSDIFDPRTQKSMSVEPTADAALDKHIARRLRSGYRWNGTTLRPETVVIYKYDPDFVAQQPESEPKPEVKPEVQPEPGPEVKPEVQPEPEAEPIIQPPVFRGPIVAADDQPSDD